MQREIKDSPLSLLPWLAGKASLLVRVSCARGKRLCNVVRGNLARLGFFLGLGEMGEARAGVYVLGTWGGVLSVLWGPFFSWTWGRTKIFVERGLFAEGEGVPRGL